MAVFVIRAISTVALAVVMLVAGILLIWPVITRYRKKDKIYPSLSAATCDAGSPILSNDETAACNVSAELSLSYSDFPWSDEDRYDPDQFRNDTDLDATLETISDRSAHINHCPSIVGDGSIHRNTSWHTREHVLAAEDGARSATE